jgi:hypothetical protein
MDKELKAKIGEPIDFTDAELEQMAEVNPHDLKVAVKLWENAAPEPFKKLLESKIQDRRRCLVSPTRIIRVLGAIGTESQDALSQ